jgi:hypothetical protein
MVWAEFGPWIGQNSGHGAGRMRGLVTRVCREGCGASFADWGVGVGFVVRIVLAGVGDALRKRLLEGASTGSWG